MSALPAMRPRIWPMPVAIMTAVLVLIGIQFRLGPIVGYEGMFATWSTLFVAIVVQALPFLVLGVVVSGLIAGFLPRNLLSRITPRSPLLAVPAASVAGVFLPGCECASVPVSQSLMRRGLSQAAALAFLLAAPAINPIVMVATAIAFLGNPTMVWARFVASLLAVLMVCWLWVFLGKEEWMKPQEPGGHHHSGWGEFREVAVHDLMQAGGFLVVGAGVAALMKVALPVGWLTALSENPWLAVACLALLAVLLSLCSEADAFVVSSMSFVSPTAQLAFLVVGPMVDVKLFAMQSGAFGTRFALRFMPLTFVVCVLSAVFVGWLML